MASPWLVTIPVEENISLRRRQSVARAVVRIQSSLTIPAFNFTSIWSRSSKIIAQFDINLAGSVRFPVPFLIPGFNETYLPCIKYRIGDTVYRYKLRSGIGEVLHRYNDYAGEQIKKNFVLEIWDVYGQANISQAAFTLSIPLLVVPNPWTEETRNLGNATVYSTALYQDYPVSLPWSPGMVSAWLDNI